MGSEIFLFPNILSTIFLPNFFHCILWNSYLVVSENLYFLAIPFLANGNKAVSESHVFTFGSFKSEGTHSLSPRVPGTHRRGLRSPTFPSTTLVVYLTAKLSFHTSASYHTTLLLLLIRECLLNWSVVTSLLLLLPTGQRRSLLHFQKSATTGVYCI